MERKNNYQIQMEQAKRRFLRYDGNALAEKFGFDRDEDYLYPEFVSRTYRLSRKDGDLRYREGDCWKDGNSFEEVMTLLDLLCDSREDRWVRGMWENMQTFGLQFHRNLLEESRDLLAERIDRDPQWFCRACEALGAEKIKGGDYGYALALFDGLKVGVLFWHGDEEFAPRIRWLWDANAKMYLRYETMHYAVGLLKRRLAEQK